MPQYRNLHTGEPGPWFLARANTRDQFALDSVGGRYFVLCFFISASDAKAKAAVDLALAHPGLFDDKHASFFGVSIDPADEAKKRRWKGSWVSIVLGFRWQCKPTLRRDPARCRSNKRQGGCASHLGHPRSDVARPKSGSI
jgi:hypothetical protein